MRIALISDIHGNAVAFDAVLADLVGEPIDQLVCLGDVSAFGPQPRECIARLKGLRYPVIQGNTDAWLLDPEPADDDASEAEQRLNDIGQWCVEQLTGSDRKFLRTFQERVQLSLGRGDKLLCFHGTPRSDDERLTVDTPADEVDEMLDGHDAAVMAGGHTHIPMLRRHRQGTIVNPGSIGMAVDPAPPADEPTHPPWAEYAVLGWDQGRLSLEWRRVPYDVDTLVLTARQSGMPHVEWWSDQFRRG